MGRREINPTSGVNPLQAMEQTLSQQPADVAKRVASNKPFVCAQCFIGSERKKIVPMFAINVLAGNTAVGGDTVIYRCPVCGHTKASNNRDATKIFGAMAQKGMVQHEQSGSYE